MCSIKRGNSNTSLSVSSFLLDIEGTTTSISFVKDELFPYIRKHLRDYVERMWKSPDFGSVLEALKSQAKEDAENKVEGLVAIPEAGDDQCMMNAVVDNVLWQMDKDRKTKALKDLQGLIMEEGYTKGELKGHIYEDVEPCLKEWTALDKSVYIYSSGSVHAQKLLFGHSVKGDLLPLMKGHFDTTVGMKADVQSYKNILAQISCDPSQVAFLTDVPKEARAAKEAGITAVLVSREGNAPLTDEEAKEFPVITTFEEIEFEKTTKRAKLSEESGVADNNKQISVCSMSLVNTIPPNPTTDEDEKMDVDELPNEKNNEVGENIPLQEPKKEEVDSKSTDKTDDIKEVDNPVDNVDITKEKKIESKETPQDNLNTTPVSEEVEEKSITEKIEMKEIEVLDKTEQANSGSEVQEKTVHKKLSDEGENEISGEQKVNEPAEVKTVVENEIKPEPQNSIVDNEDNSKTGVDMEKSIECNVSTEEAASKNKEPENVVPILNGNDDNPESKLVDESVSQNNDTSEIVEAPVKKDVPDVVEVAESKIKEPENCIPTKTNIVPILNGDDDNSESKPVGEKVCQNNDAKENLEDPVKKDIPNMVEEGASKIKEPENDIPAKTNKVPILNGDDDNTENKSVGETVCQNSDTSEINGARVKEVIPDVVEVAANNTEETKSTPYPQDSNQKEDVGNVKNNESDDIPIDVNAKINGKGSHTNGALEKVKTENCVNGQSSPSHSEEATNGIDAANETSSKHEAKNGDPAVEAAFEVEA